eukprot:1670915-Pleurochrysis_carterae.AAC.1
MPRNAPRVVSALRVQGGKDFGEVLRQNGVLPGVRQRPPRGRQRRGLGDRLRARDDAAVSKRLVREPRLRGRARERSKCLGGPVRLGRAKAIAPRQKGRPKVRIRARPLLQHAAQTCDVPAR